MKVKEFQKHNLIKDFVKDRLPDMVKERLSDLAVKSVFSKEVEKNNGQIYTGITVVVEDQEMAPCIYVESYLPPDPAELTEETWGRIADRLASDFRYAIDAIRPDDTELFRVEDIPDHLVLDVVNQEKNKNMMKKYPHRKYLDLVIFMKWKTVCGGRRGTIYISDYVLKLWGKSFDELYETALSNTIRQYPGRIEPLGDILLEFSRDAFRGMESPFFYLGTRKGVFGSSVILYPDFLHQVYERLGKPFYVIPSSVNELLVLPADREYEVDRLKELIRDVNSSMLEETEVLSDSLYRYEPDRNALEIM